MDSSLFARSYLGSTENFDISPGHAVPEIEGVSGSPFGGKHLSGVGADGITAVKVLGYRNTTHGPGNPEYPGGCHSDIKPKYRW